MTPERTPERAVTLLGEGARPFCIVFLAVMMGFGIFVPGVRTDALVVLGGMFTILVSARSYENSTKIKADASLKKTETVVTQERGPAIPVAGSGAPQ